MLISEMLTPSLIKTNIEAESKEELFEEMVQLFISQKLVSDRDSAVTALLEREAQMSTGIAPGVALPHGKIPGITGVIMSLGIVRNGMDYDSLDGEPVYVVITLLSELGNPGPHIEALSEISRLLAVPDFVDRMKKARTASQVLQIIKGEE